jgi:hypothetical protein
LIVGCATLVAMLGEFQEHLANQNWLLGTSSGVILVLDVWVLLEGLRLMTQRNASRAA